MRAPLPFIVEKLPDATSLALSTLQSDGFCGRTRTNSKTTAGSGGEKSIAHSCSQTGLETIVESGKREHAA